MGNALVLLSEAAIARATKMITVKRHSDHPGPSNFSKLMDTSSTTRANWLF